MALPISAVSWKMVRFLVRGLTEAIPPALAYLETTLDAPSEPASLVWMRAHTKYTRNTPAGTSEDAAEFKLDLLNLTGGVVDSTWTAADFTAVQTALSFTHSFLLPQQSNAIHLSELRIYRMEFNPDDEGPVPRGETRHVFKKTGPPVSVANLGGSTGTGAGMLPYQVATSVTLKTAWPKHWGRIYVPLPSYTPDAYGRIPSAHRVAVANAVLSGITHLADAGFLTVVPVTQLDKVKFHGLLGVGQVVVDDIPDVQRRRRARTVAARTVGV